jgi:hypothetical protein
MFYSACCIAHKYMSIKDKVVVARGDMIITYLHK